MPRQSFEEIVLPHLDAAFNYARWLTRSEADAEDVVQDAYMRAFKFFSSFRGEDARAWLLTIVRNTWYGRFPRGAGRLPMSSIDETGDDPLDEGLDPQIATCSMKSALRTDALLSDIPGRNITRTRSC